MIKFFRLYLSPKRKQAIDHIRRALYIEHTYAESIKTKGVSSDLAYLYEQLAQVHYDLAKEFICVAPPPRFLRPNQVLKEYFSSKKSLKKRLDYYIFMYNTLHEGRYRFSGFCSLTSLLKRNLPSDLSLQDLPELMQYEPYYHGVYWYASEYDRIAILEKIIHRLYKKVHGVDLTKKLMRSLINPEPQDDISTIQ